MINITNKFNYKVKQHIICVKAYNYQSLILTYGEC